MSSITIPKEKITNLISDYEEKVRAYEMIQRYAPNKEEVMVCVRTFKSVIVDLKKILQ